MPSTSPGSQAVPPRSPSTFTQIFPGAPAASLQAFTTFVFRFKRYVAYISGSQLNILSTPTTLTQAITFKHDLVAVAAESETGKLLVAGRKNVWVLEPHAEGWTNIWWQKELYLRREDEGDETQWLSWGDIGEALVAGDRVLTLFSTLPSSRSSSPAVRTDDDDAAEERRALWSRSVSSPIRQAEFSPSASLIASCGKFDRLVKIWRRLSYEDGLFDYMYLPHPGVVTNLQWRTVEPGLDDRRSSGISSRHDEDCEILYTVASDGILRIWRTGGIHDMEILTLHTTVDLIAAIPQSPSLTIKGQAKPQRAPRYVFILPAEQFCAAVEVAIGITADEKVSHSKELLKELLSKEPDVVIAFDGQGRMSAWGIQSIGHKRRPDTPTAAQAYHIAHAEGLQFRLPLETAAVCGSWLHEDKLNLLTHVLSDAGEVTWWQGDVETIFSTSATTADILNEIAVWSGHDREVHELKSLEDGFTSFSAKELSHWSREDSRRWKPKVSFGLASGVLAATAVDAGNLVLTVTADCFTIWDWNGTRLARVMRATQTTGRIWNTPSQPAASGFFVPDNASEIVFWTTQASECGNANKRSLQLHTVEFANKDALAEISHIVPVSMPFAVERNCIVSITKSGVVACCIVPDEPQEETALDLFLQFETAVSEAALFTANAEFAVATSQSSRDVVIVDLTDGFIEHRQVFRSAVKQLACFSPAPRHNLLALALETSIQILMQGRYEARTVTPVWRHVKTISLNDIGIGITSIAWLAHDTLAAAASTAILVADVDPACAELDVETQAVVDSGFENKSISLSSLSRLLKRPLPAWHPSVLLYLLQHGHHLLAMILIKKLTQKLKFWSPGEELSATLDEDADQLLSQQHGNDMSLDDTVINDLKDQLQEKDLPAISTRDQKRLKHIIDTMAFTREHFSGLDANALSYLVDWKLQICDARGDVHHETQLNQVNSDQNQDSFVPEMQSREICFAYHSKTQQPLLDILILHYDNKLTWPIARRLGIMAWLSEREALEKVFEQLGQTAYRADSPPDPVNASLYYLALHKKQTLLALWRIATWHKEQRTTMNFLRRDFSQADSQTAAKKNAYALMGRRRFQYAAAFFLLAQDPASATSLLAGQCEDAQFAIAVARLYCGDGSPTLQKLLQDRIMPQAEQARDRWLMSWCYSVTLQKHAAMEVLVTPLDGVKTWEQDDPITLRLYKHLRNDTSEHEYDAVLRAARILRKMGYWLPALELVSQWHFNPVSPAVRKGVYKNWTNGVREESKSLLDDYSSPPSPPKPSEPPSLLDGFIQPQSPVKPPADDKAAREAKAAELLAKIKAKKEGAMNASQSEKKKAEPTQFKEPDLNSLLDNFGF